MPSVLQVDKIIDGSATTNKELAEYSSSAWSWGAGVPAGTVLQVLQDTHSTSTSVIVDNSWNSINLSQAITPKYTNSKILILGQCSGYVRMDTTDYEQVGLAIFANDTGSSLEKYRSATITRTQDNTSTYYAPTFFSVNYLHTPTISDPPSAITYELKMRVGTNANSAQVNRDNSDSSIILMEIKQ